MSELEKLKREKEKLIAGREVREAMMEDTLEKKKLKVEIRKEKYPGLYMFFNSFLKFSEKFNYFVIKMISDFSKRKPIKKTNVKVALKTPTNTTTQIPISTSTILTPLTIPKQPTTLNEAIYGGY